MQKSINCHNSLSFLGQRTPHKELLRPLLLCVILLGATPPLSQAATKLPPIQPATQMGAWSQQLFLQASINGNRVARLLPFEQKGDSLWASPEVLRKIGFKQVEQGTAKIDLNTLPGVTVSYNAASQAVAIIAPADALDLERTTRQASQSETIQTTRGTGALLNYDLYGVHDPDSISTLSAASEMRVFSPLGVLNNTMLTTLQTKSKSASSQTSSYSAYNRSARNVRLDTAWHSFWPESEISLSIGDTTTSYLPWSRSVRIGGIRFGRDFSLTPYRITSPLPAFMGTAVLPSAVDLYIDGIKRYNGQLPAGPFRLDNMPVVTGMGNAQVALTDSLGRRTLVEIPFYSSNTLLAQGLSDWSLAAGYVRKDYGYASFSYEKDPVYSGTIRYGISNNLTLEGHGEYSRRAATLGGGAVATLGVLGQVSASYSASRSEGLKGSQYSLGYQWQSRRFNIGMNSVRSNGQYQDIASAYSTSSIPRVSESAVAGVSLDKLGSLNVSYVHTRYGKGMASAYDYNGSAFDGYTYYSGSATSNRYAGAYWSKSFGGRATLSVSYNRSLNAPHDNTVFVGLSLYFDKNRTVSSAVQRSNNQSSYSVSASQATPGETGWNWTVQGQKGQNSKYGNAEVSYRSLKGDYRVGVNAYGQSNSVYAGASGSVVTMDGALFTGRKVYDGFAVVSTSGVPDVPVMLENRQIGLTDAQGRLMISPLGAYQKNQISINPLNLPTNMKIDQVNVNIAPQKGSGVVVNFALRPTRAATITIHDRTGRPVAVGVPLSLNGIATGAVMGYDGLAYLEDLQDDNTLLASMPQAACIVHFSYPKSNATLPSIGPLTCE
ncbi:fimbria/pilus outer membrane usher protein [Allopusillimonas ginsengisoli]|uniref:fimbria/pilus outer membrane usher protein n=1 Tax=Allopusillimonas ginsengisoli TaxID=453575 RepID=UPI0010C16F67|nr:fimbrial biogenesis outer membrane usher protein [Allopusillimonas ginsengisoli]